MVIYVKIMKLQMQVYNKSNEGETMQTQDVYGAAQSSDLMQAQDNVGLSHSSDLVPAEENAATAHITVLADLPIDMSYQNILSRLTPTDFRALRAVSLQYKHYIDRVYQQGHCWQQWLKAEFPRAAMVPAHLAREAYFNCLKQNYGQLVYYPNKRFPQYQLLQAFLCGGYDQFFLQMNNLSKSDQYQCLHAGFSMGFFLLRIARQRGLDYVIERLNSTAWAATCEVINAPISILKKKAREEAKRKIGSDFHAIRKSPLISEGFANDNYELITTSIENLNTDQKLQFLIGIHGEFRHLLHVLLHSSKIGLVKPLIQHVELLCHSDPNYSPLLQPEGVVCLSARLFQPLFSFVALGKNEDFKKCFITLNLPEQCHILTHSRADGMTLIMLAAHNGNLDFLVWASQFVNRHSEVCNGIMDINVTFGEEPLIEAWNSGHIDCVDYLLEIYPKLFLYYDYSRRVWQNVLPAAISDLELSSKVLTCYIRNSKFTRLDTALKPVIFKILHERIEHLIPNLIKLCHLFDEVGPNVNRGTNVGWERIIREYFSLLCTKGDEDSVCWMWNSRYFQPANKVFCTDTFNPLCNVADLPSPKPVAKMLLAQGCRVTPTQADKYTPLMAACKYLNQELLEILLEEQDKGIDIGMNFFNNLPLRTAIQFNRMGDTRLRGYKSKEQKLEFVRALISHGADVTEVDVLNRPIIALCCRPEFTPEILLLLLNSYPNAASRYAHCYLRDNLEGKSGLFQLIHYYTRIKHMDLSTEITKLFILLQYGTDPNLCLNKGNLLSRLMSHYPIDNSWPNEIKEAIRFCCDFRAKVLTGATLVDLEKLQHQHPVGFFYLARGILHNTLFIEPAQIQAIEHLKPLLQQLVERAEYSGHRDCNLHDIRKNTP
jgi:ankyrin repeat protein